MESSKDATPQPQALPELVAASPNVFAALEWIDDFIARCNGDDRGACESVNIIRAALASQPPAPAEAGRVVPITKEALTDLIREQLGYGVYHCTRVWEAWSVGTMSESDFSPYADSDSPEELADAILAAIAAQPPSPQPAVSTPAQPAREGRDYWQQYCSDRGFYWRAPDAHGVNLTHEQALELLRDLLRVEVEIATPPAPPAVVPAERWLPIESAPKDHLVDIFAYGKRYNACHYDRICSEFRHITHCGVLIRLRGATHWMEMLPAPPAPTLSASAGKEQA